MKMDTRLLDEKNEQDIKEAGKILRRGGLVAIPTETVYGLAGNAHAVRTDIGNQTHSALAFKINPFI